MKNYTERRLEEFDEKSVTLFTRNGLAVLLDYPPHDMVLDEGIVRDFLSKSIAQAEQEMVKKLGDKWSLARFMHEKYEQYAFIFGWDTQEKTKVEFDNLPEENKKTMLGVASEILLLLNKEIKNNK